VVREDSTMQGPIDTQSRDHQSRHDLDADTDRDERVTDRAREDAPGLLGRLRARLRRHLGRD
jgi:hypothetical protein